LSNNTGMILNRHSLINEEANELRAIVLLIHSFAAFDSGVNRVQKFHSVNS